MGLFLDGVLLTNDVALLAKHLTMAYLFAKSVNTRVQRVRVSLKRRQITDYWLPMVINFRHHPPYSRFVLFVHFIRQLNIFNRSTLQRLD